MSTNRFGKPDWPRFKNHVDFLPNGCWHWKGAIRGNGRNEYGAFWANGTQRAHIVAYVWTYGEPNADLHHTCDDSLCVNPEHVTPASAGQPRHRNPSPNYCRLGHEFTADNTYVNPRGERQCKTCLRAASARHLEANRDAINAKRRANRERVSYEPRACPICGTVFTPQRSTGRYCAERACINERQRRNRQGRLGGTD